MTAETFVATSVARRLISRFQQTHERRRISVFAGPPGIGKTTAIDAFRKRAAGNVAVVKVARRNAREVLVLQHALEALRQLSGSEQLFAATSVWELRNALFGEICSWAGVDCLQARRGEFDACAFPALTLIFDEAQNLSREAIEALRYWNDADRCYAPFPIGLIFVGNSEFSLAGATAESVISAAVADRALYLQTLAYDDVTDDDLRLFVDVIADIDEEAVRAILRSFHGTRSIRSFRRMADLVHDLRGLSSGRQISTEDVREALAAA